MSKSKIFFKNLDAIRFIAALMVFLQHGIKPAFEYLPIKGTAWEHLIGQLSNGKTGVAIFFVLSGFLITYLLLTEHEVKSKISLKNFYVRRVLRIWPLYYLIVTFTFIIYPGLKSLIGMNNPLAANWKYYFTFLSNFDLINYTHNPIGEAALSENVTWSVAIEEQFYVFWPLLFVLLPKRAWLSAILIVLSSSILFRILNNDDRIILYLHTISNLPDLAMGGLMAYIIKNNERIRLLFERTSTGSHLLLFIIVIIVIGWGDQIIGSNANHLLTVFVFALIISAQAMTKSNSRLNLNKFSFADRWGKYTYGIYLIHPIPLTLLSVAVRILHIPVTTFISSLLYGIIAFIITLVLSKLSYDYYESKFLKLKERFTTIKSHPVEAPK
jgi:peptidoglycan/LPS O-acetylase OafA/YrhL